MGNFLTPLQEYVQSQVTASIFLLVCTIIALVWATLSNYQLFYKHFITTSIGFHIADFHIAKTLQFWVNDVLLTFFFFLVGLEIKREFLVGELTNRKRAIFVLLSAAGGMIIPAGLYLLFNYGTPAQHGWGIAMATDTAFALGVLAFFSQRLPRGLFTFMAALAIIDDIGAILVIAFFYTDTINTHFLFAGLIVMVAIMFINFAGFRKPIPYLILGLCFWVID